VVVLVLVSFLVKEFLLVVAKDLTLKRGDIVNGVALYTLDKVF
jgi:hypothetical protein